MVSSLVPEVVRVKPDPGHAFDRPDRAARGGPRPGVGSRAPDPKPPAKPGLPVAVELLAAVELLLEELEEQATMPKEPPPISTIAAIPAVVTLPRLLANIN